jgi:2-methylisocitrate lyase-like PEP mutase family enzyme
LGYSLVIFPGGVVRALAKTAVDYYRALILTGSNESFKGRMYDFDGLNDVIETHSILSQAKKYAN